MKCTIGILVGSLLTGCNSGAPDMGPVGGGLSVIGLGIVIAAVIRSIAGALSHHEDDERGGSRE